MCKNKTRIDKIGSINMTKESAFTIVELLVVIVIIGVLAAITIVAYRGITQKAIETSLTSDLSNASTKLKVFQSEKGVYPTTLNCSLPDSDTNLCIKFSDKNSSAEYSVDNSKATPTFQLSATHTNNVTYRVNNDATPIACPIGFIIVPGSATYGTSDFCVMKYEAKQVGSTGVPESRAPGTPWTNISQNDAVTASAKINQCTSCHLITEAQWLTIAQNILMTKTNWSGGGIGVGYIYPGHVFQSPNRALEAGTDSDIYHGLDTSTDPRMKRTLTLSNGETIWDFGGNVREWTTGIATGGLPGVNGAGWGWREWNANTNPGSLPQPSPSPSTAYAAAASWVSDHTTDDSQDKFIGKLFSNSDYAATTAYTHGGRWDDWQNGGIFSLGLGYAPSSNGFDVDLNDYTIGFRVTR